MKKQYRSRRAELVALRTELSTKGATTRHLAYVIRARYNVNSRVAFRLAHGFTQQFVADAWNQLWPPQDGEPTITHKHLSYWEAWPGPAGRVPSPIVLNRLARIYRCAAAELLDGEDHSNEATQTADPAPRQPGAATVATRATTGASAGVRADPSDVLSRVDTFIAHSGPSLVNEADFHTLVRLLIEWACGMKRRDIVQWLSWAAAAAAAAPVLDGLDHGERDRAVQALSAPNRVDATVVDHIEGVLWRCRRQDDALGPQAALDTVLAQRSLVRNLLPHTPAAVKDRMLSLYAGLSQFAGWLSFDLRNYVAATDYYEIARAAAHEAHNTALGALVLCNLSQTATWRGQARIGIDHAVAAQGWASRTEDGPLRAFTYDVAARAYAKDGQAHAALESIARARAALADAPAEQPTLVYYYGSGTVAGTESFCHLQLGDPGRAAESVRIARGAIAPEFVRDHAMLSLRTGICRLRMPKPDVEGAAAAMADAVQLASYNHSARLVERLGYGWRELEPYRDQPEVRALGDQLATYGIA